jgi:hypothetical protein
MGCHTALDLVQRREFGRGYSPCLGGPVGCHLAEAQWPPLKRDDSPGMVLANGGCQVDPSLSEVGLHHPVVLEQLLLLRLQGGRRSNSSTPAQWSSQ